MKDENEFEFEIKDDKELPPLKVDNSIFNSHPAIVIWSLSPNNPSSRSSLKKFYIFEILFLTSRVFFI